MFDEVEVFDLDGRGFDTFINSHEHVLVMFYDLRSGRCKRFYPEFQDLSIESEFAYPDLKFAKVVY